MKPSRRRIISGAFAVAATAALLGVPATQALASAYPPPCPPQSILQPNGDIVVSVGCVRVVTIPLGG